MGCLHTTDSGPKTVVITGTNRGIGFALVEKLLAGSTKYNIIITARDKSKGEKALKTLKEKCPNSVSAISFHELDVSSKDSIDHFVGLIKSDGHVVDFLINNAGVGLIQDYGDPNGTINADEIHRTLAVNVHGVINLTQALLPHLDSKGKIITISSSLGLLNLQGDEVKKVMDSSNWTLDSLIKYTNDFEALAAKNEHKKAGFSKGVYQVSKALVNVYNRWVLKPQLKHQQTCFVVNPGWCRTDMGTQAAALPVEEGPNSTIAAMNFSLEDSVKNNGRYLDLDGTPKDY